MRLRTAGWIRLLAVVIGSVTLHAADDKTITAHLAGSAIALDGRLTEEEWAQAQVVTDFVQSEPKAGGEPSERTEVRVLYDHDNLYIGATCFDSEPKKIVISDLKRDFE